MLRLPELIGNVPTPEEAFRLFMTPVRVEMARKERAVWEAGRPWQASPAIREIVGREWGSPDAPLAVLLHGWNGRGAAMSGFVESLVVRNLRVLAFDAPGHGDSPGELCYAPMVAECLFGIAEEVAPLHAVVGHSFGGCAINVGLKRGLPVDRVALVSPLVWIKQRFFEFAVAVGLDEAGEREMWTLAEEFFGFGEIEEFHGDVAASSFTQPALITHDEEDSEILIAQAESLHQSWAGSQLVRTKGLGHYRILRSKEVYESVADFCAP